MPRCRFPTGPVVLATMLATPGIVGFHVAIAADAGTKLDLTPLREKKSVFVRKADGGWVEGKPIGVLGDSLVLRKGHDLVRLNTGEIAGVWTERPAPGRTALVFGAGGLVGGALVELGFAADCPDCQIDAEDVLGAAARAGMFGGLLGAIGGLFGGRWEQLVPVAPEGKGAEPFPAWGATLSGGVAHFKSVQSDPDDPFENEFFAHTATWSFDSPTMSSGFEYGALPGGESRLTHVSPNETYEETDRSRWGYATGQVRWRASRGTARPEVTFGLGSYVNRVATTLVVRNGQGAITSQASVEARDASLGMNLGAGASFGRGNFLPGIEARVHWALSPDQRWYTLGFEANWH